MSSKSPFTTQIERGGYSAIVYADGDYIVAEDDVGVIIAEGTNAATVINAAVDSLPANGGLVFLKDKFTTTATITIDTEGVTLIGDSWGNSGLSTTSNIPLITITPAAVKTIIERMWLEGANDVAKTANHGILFSGATVKYDIQLRDLIIHQTYDGLNGSKVSYLYLDNLQCVKSKHDGFHITADGSDYSTIFGTNVFLKQNANIGMYFTYLMGSKFTNMFVEGDSISYRGIESDNGFMNCFTNMDLENFTDMGAYLSNDKYSTITASWFGGNGNVGVYADGCSMNSVSQSVFVENDTMGLYFKNCERMIINNSFAQKNSITGAGSYSGFTFENTTNSIISNSHSYDDQGTKTQHYGIEEIGTSDYNKYIGNNLRSNQTLGILTVGAHNSYDLNLKSTIFDLSGGASDIEVFHAIAPCTLVGYQILYTEASSADAGVNIRIGRYQSGVALDDDYFDVSASEVSKNKGYAKFFKTADLTQKVIAVGDTITVGTAGAKTGTGEVCLILLFAEQSD